ncbi:MAG: hypothetical protein ACLFPL_05285 [Candidatus Nanoarchaeia archaeon]
MIQKSRKGLLGILSAVVLSTPTQAESKLENLNVLKGCSSDLVQEFESALGIYGTDPYQRVRDGETLTTGYSPFSEREFNKCMRENGEDWSMMEGRGHNQSLDFCSKVEKGSFVSNIIKKDQDLFCLYDSISKN